MVCFLDCMGSLCQTQCPQMFVSGLRLPMQSLLPGFPVPVLWEHLRKCHFPAVSAAPLLGCLQSALAQILHTFFPIQISVSLPVHDNAPLHTGCVLQVLREMIKPLNAYCPFPVSMATMIKCFFSHISGMPFTSFLPTFQFPSGEGDAASPAASAGTDPYGKDVYPGQTLEQMGQRWAAGGHHPGTNPPPPKQVSSEEAIVTPGQHQEPESARLALLTVAGVDGESQVSPRRAALLCRGVLCHMGFDFPSTGPTDQHNRTAN